MCLKSHVDTCGAYHCRAKWYITGYAIESLKANCPAPKDVDCSSFLMLNFSAAFGGSICVGLLTGDLTGVICVSQTYRSMK